MKELLSLRFWKCFVAKPMKRYPVAAVCSLIAAVCFYIIVVGIYNEKLAKGGVYLTMLCSMSAAFVALALARRKSTDAYWKERKWPYVMVILTWVAVTAYVVWQYATDRLHYTTCLGLFVSSMLATILLPLLYTKDGNTMLHHTTRSVNTMMSAYWFGVKAFFVAGLGFGLLYVPLSLMTSLRFPIELFVILVATIPFLLMLFHYMNHESAGRKLSGFTSSVPDFNAGYKFLLGFFGYVSLVMCLYMLIILFSMELPRGYISLVCCAITALGLLVYLSVANTNHEKGGRWMAIHRLIPWLLLPIQVLMTVAIARRIYDYGVTIPRCYIVLVNAWAYAACLYIIIHQGRELRRIPLSFCLLFFICTATPLSCSNYVRWQLVDDIKSQRGRYNDKALYLMKEFGDDILKQEGISLVIDASAYED